MRGAHPQFHSPTICERGIPPLIFVGDGSLKRATAARLHNIYALTVMQPLQGCFHPRHVFHEDERAGIPPALSHIVGLFYCGFAPRIAAPAYLPAPVRDTASYPRIADLCPMPPIRPFSNRLGRFYPGMDRLFCGLPELLFADALVCRFIAAFSNHEFFVCELRYGQVCSLNVFSLSL